MADITDNLWAWGVQCMDYCLLSFLFEFYSLMRIFGLSSKLQVFFNKKMLSQECDLRTVNFFDSVLLKTKRFWQCAHSGYSRSCRVQHLCYKHEAVAVANGLKFPPAFEWNAAVIISWEFNDQIVCYLWYFHFQFNTAFTSFVENPFEICYGFLIWIWTKSSEFSVKPEALLERLQQVPVVNRH